MAPGVELAVGYVSIVPSTKGLAKSLSDDLGRPAKKAAEEAGQSIEEGLSGGATRGSQAAKLAISAIGSAAVLAGLNRAKDAASGLQQAVGGTEAVFGEAGDTVDEFARGAAEAIGLSERQTRELTSQIGAGLKGFGFAVDEAAEQSIRLTEIGADLAATFGGTTSEAVQALSSALRGEFDPLERFGIALRQSAIDAKAVQLGLADSTTNVDAYARAQAALSLITEQSADAQGQFAREADSAAGQAQISQAKIEDAAADLGEALLPIYSAISSATGTLAQAFGALPGPVQTALLALVAFVAVADNVTSIVGLYRSLTGATAASTVATHANTTAVAANATAVNSAATVNGLYAVSAGRAATAARTFSTALGFATAAFAGYGVAAALVNTQNANAAESGSELADQFRSEVGAVETYADFLNVTNQRISEYNALMEDASSGTDIFNNHSLNEAAKEIDDVIGTWAGLNDVIAAYANEGLGTADEATQAITRHMDEVTALLNDGYTPAETAAQVAVLDRAQAEAEALAVTEDYTSASRNGAEAAQEYADSLDDAKQNLRDLLDLQTSTVEGEIAFRDALRGFADIQARVNDGTLTGQERVDAFTTQLLQGRDNVLDLVDAMVDQGVATDEIVRRTDEYVDQLFDTADQAGLTGREVEFLRAQLGLMPDQIETTLETNFDDVLFDLQQIADAYARFGGGTLDLQTNDDLLGSRASGGPIWGPGSWQVHADEIVTLGRGETGFVLPADLANVGAPAPTVVSVPIQSVGDELGAWSAKNLETAARRGVERAMRDRAWSLV